MSEGSEFQTEGAEHRKARVASSVLVNGTVISVVSEARQLTAADLIYFG